MKISDVIKWYWHSNSGWDHVEYMGIIVGSRIVKNDYEKFLIYNVLLADGSLCEVRDDAGLEQVA